MLQYKFITGWVGITISRSWWTFSINCWYENTWSSPRRPIENDLFQYYFDNKLPLVVQYFVCWWPGNTCCHDNLMHNISYATSNQKCRLWCFHISLRLYSLSSKTSYRQISKLQDWMLLWSYRSETLQASRQRCCRGACPNLEWLEKSKPKSRDFEASRDLAVRRQPT